MNLKPLVLAAFFFPSIVLSASFDCEKAASLSEMLICNDPELSATDEKLGRIYKKAKSSAANRAKFIQQSKASWRWREANCKDKACLIAWYSQREQTLLGIIKSDVNPEKESCLKHGTVELKGMVTAVTFPLEPDGRLRKSYLLNLKQAMCVRIEPIDIGEARNVTIQRVELVSYSSKSIRGQIAASLFKEVEVKGILSTDNVSQYYAEQIAIDVQALNEL